ncbi:hypothetical protein BX616_003418 [Lobosporangium transversale]|nr:hypothetical protein BX616_003418 [Lobosporangium transversale]
MRIQWSDLKTFDIIGSGSFGRVFHGDLLGTEVAIKECVRSNSKAFDEKYFKREVDILKQSRHPNIVQFMGICKRKKRFYIVTEFLPLGNLRRWIQDETKEFGWDTRISFAIDISLALAYLHHKNIIHRDLKGENLLISENMRIKVCDFGFSRVEAKDDDEMRRISYCGTDGYMAPEILLGEDFDCSVDVFSFGIVLAEMMARHVVDPQHFQRVPPDMSVSPDEILFRAQPGCPIELGELAIHCVQPLPQNRPKLKQIVERLTAIENVDIHVGTTLVVAPSVARAARNMMRKKEVETKRLQQQQHHLYQHQNQQLLAHGDGLQMGQLQFYPEASSSIHGEANTWRMTDDENLSSHMAESMQNGSQSTYRGKQWKRVNRGEEGDQAGSSAVPFVLEDRRRQNKEQSGSTLQWADAVEDDDMGLRMPLWDSINSPHNQMLLRQWHGSDPTAQDSDSTYLRSWDLTRQQNTQGETQELSQLSSIQIDFNDKDDGDDDGNYTFGSGGSSDEDEDSLFDEDSDREFSSRQLQGGQLVDMYELSSDSDESLSADSLTESVVMALDNLEIPDHSKSKLLQNHHQLQPVITDVEAELGGNDDCFSKSYVTGGQEQERGTILLKRPSLISRLSSPAIAGYDNPWTSLSQATASAVVSNTGHSNFVETFLQRADNSKDSDTSAVLPSLESHVITGEKKQENVQDQDLPPTPPTPPSKSSILFRANTTKGSTDQQSTPIAIVDALSLEKSTIGNSADRPRISTEDSSSSTVTTTTATTISQSTSRSSASSLSAVPLEHDENNIKDTPSPESKDQDSGEDECNIDRDTDIGPAPYRGLGLIRGMSDSVLGSASDAIGAGGTMTSNLIAAMGAKTWTSGTGGFGHWIGHYTTTQQHQPNEDLSGNNNRTAITMLRKHTSLKEGKQQRVLLSKRGISNLDLLPIEKHEDEETDRRGGMAKDKDRNKPSDIPQGPELAPTVKRRTKTLTGFPHRFSLVVFSTQLLPKCDVCQKRLGVLPGWSSKHLECDDCGYKTHPKCVPNVVKCCTSARKSGLWDIPV